MINNDWDLILSDTINTKYFKELMKKIEKQYKEKTIYPEYDNIFNALKLTPYNKVKAVIIGQDPYHNPNEAHGLVFSVKENVKIPPSLRNIFNELKNDLNIDIPSSGNLTKWANEGILLLNTILTVEKNKPLSHKNIGWELFTDTIIRKLNNKKNPVVFILWGSFAKSKKQLITNKKHLIIENVHPSPLSAYNGFFNSKPFSKTNEFLLKNGIKEIDFKL